MVRKNISRASHTSGVARAFPGGQVAHSKGQNEEENKLSLRKNKKNWSKFEEKMRKVEPLPTRDCEAGYGPDGYMNTWYNNAVIKTTISKLTQLIRMINDMLAFTHSYFGTWLFLTGTEIVHRPIPKGRVKFWLDFNILKRIIFKFDFNVCYTVRLPNKSFTYGNSK